MELGDLAAEVVFVGGATTALLLSDPAAPDVRPTIDVDVIVEISSRVMYHVFGERLRGKGFCEASEQGVICRWKKGSLILDVMPTDPKILGFSNRWYVPAAHHARQMDVQGATVWVITPPYFIATKMEAFFGRGKGDFLSSSDIEDVIAVLDGCKEIVDHVRNAEPELRGYLAEQAALLLGRDAEEYIISGNLPPDAASQKRSAIVRERLGRIAANAPGP